MRPESSVYQMYLRILDAELKPAMGCTEPIAVAFCAAKAKETLGSAVEKIVVKASGNIIKNVKSVVVPNTGGMKGLEAAAAVGAFFGNAAKELEVVSEITEAEIAALKPVMEKTEITVEPLDSEHVLDVITVLYGGGHEATVRIQDDHTNIVRIEKDGEVLFENTAGIVTEDADLDYECLSVDDIIDFADTVELDDIREVLERQIRLNTAISNEGLTKPFGARIGQILAMEGRDVKTKAKAAAAAASDARMSGSEMPVVINSGSGNQGITTSVPVIVYAEHYGKSHEELLRALAVSNLITLHLKAGIGRLSAYCGAVSAGVGAGAGIAYLLTHDVSKIHHTIVNAVAITSGIICDGAKASCAAKIAMAVEAGVLGLEMIEGGSQFYGGEGLVSKGVENTIRNISVLGQEGMKETDRTIIKLMTEC